MQHLGEIKSLFNGHNQRSFADYRDDCVNPIPSLLKQTDLDSSFLCAGKEVGGEGGGGGREREIWGRFPRF